MSTTTDILAPFPYFGFPLKRALFGICHPTKLVSKTRYYKYSQGKHFLSYQVISAFTILINFWILYRIIFEILRIALIITKYNISITN
jgi:hypothetical protein